MENASKALIISGAILIAIILISLGILIIKPVTPMVNSVNRVSDATGDAVFNNQFTKYGDYTTGSNVRALINAIDAYNASNGAEPDINSSEPSTIQPGKDYKLSYGYDTNGRVNEVTITE